MKVVDLEVEVKVIAIHLQVAEQLIKVVMVDQDQVVADIDLVEEAEELLKLEIMVLIAVLLVMVVLV